METKEAAKEIRKELKAEGLNARKVSVRCEFYAGGSSISVIIKDSSVSLPLVSAIAEKFERIRRCEITHDILGGGNCFVETKYSYEAKEERREPVRAAVLAAIAELGSDYRANVAIKGTDLTIMLDAPEMYVVFTSSDTSSSKCWGSAALMDMAAA